MKPLTPERLAEIEKRCNKFRDSGYMWERFAQYAVVDLGDLLSEIKRLRERDSELTDLLDLAHDDFQRVEALTDDTELRGIALRGQAKIRQNVPVIRQRDELENAVIKLDGLNDQLRAQLSDARAALKVKDEALVRLSEQRGTLLGVATTFKQTVFLGEDRPLKQEQRERLLQNLAEIIKDCSDNTATAAPQPGRE
jgi:hypothetical protein